MQGESIFFINVSQSVISYLESVCVCLHQKPAVWANLRGLGLSMLVQCVRQCVSVWGTCLASVPAEHEKVHAVAVPMGLEWRLQVSGCSALGSSSQAGGISRPGADGGDGCMWTVINDVAVYRQRLPKNDFVFFFLPNYYPSKLHKY